MNTINKSDNSTIEIKIVIDGKFYLQHVSHYAAINEKLKHLVASGVYRGIHEMMRDQYGIEFGDNNDPTR